MTDPDREKWYFPFRQALRSGAFIVAHFSVALFFVATNYIIEHVLYAEGDPKLFDILPWRWVFDVIDVVLIAVFGVMGTLEAIRVFRGKE